MKNLETLRMIATSAAKRGNRKLAERLELILMQETHEAQKASLMRRLDRLEDRFISAQRPRGHTHA